LIIFDIISFSLFFFRQSDEHCPIFSPAAFRHIISHAWLAEERRPPFSAIFRYDIRALSPFSSIAAIIDRLSAADGQLIATAERQRY
jgi:hypothetical protein